MDSGWKKIKAEDITSFLSELSRIGELWVPQNIEGKWQFELLNSKEVEFPGSIIDVSLKHLFFPRRRPIARYEEDTAWSLTQAEIPNNTRIIMGLHPCDVAGIEYMDDVFLKSAYKDTLYKAERERTVLVGLLCKEMSENCHCTDRGLSPDRMEGMDVAFSKADGGFIFKSITRKGEKILGSKLLKETDEAPIKADWQKGRFVVGSPKEFAENYNENFLDDISDFCLTCGICTFACPTCVCFLVSDERFRSEVERVTVWDSCQFVSYSRMAGGHNPRKTNTSRVSNRILDKFLYSYLKYGKISCIGCGRCITACPLKLSTPRIASLVTEKMKGGGTTKDVSAR